MGDRKPTSLARKNSISRRGSLENTAKDIWLPSEPSEDEKAGKANRMKSVKNKILIAGGKGGTGKSTITAQLARALASKGARVGVLDADISSPAIPTLLGTSSSLIMHSKEGWVPVKTDDNILVMSIDYLIPTEKREEALLWHDSRKIDILRQFIDNVHWGELDYLIIDSPTGFSDLISALHLHMHLDSPGSGAYIVTTPQKLALTRAQKDIDYFRKSNIPVLGVIENMTPSGAKDSFHATTGGAASLNFHIAASIPIDRNLAEVSDGGIKLSISSSLSAFEQLAKDILK